MSDLTLRFGEQVHGVCGREGPLPEPQRPVRQALGLQRVPAGGDAEKRGQ